MDLESGLVRFVLCGVRSRYLESGLGAVSGLVMLLYCGVVLVYGGIRFGCVGIGVNAVFVGLICTEAFQIGLMCKPVPAGWFDLKSGLLRRFDIGSGLIS